MDRVYCFKLTSDDWYSEYKISKDVRYENAKFVCVTFHGNLNAYDSTMKPVYRTSVWGNDDTGIDKDSEIESEAFELYLDLCSLKNVTKEYCLKRGMNYF